MLALTVRVAVCDVLTLGEGVGVTLTLGEALTVGEGVGLQLTANRVC